MERNRHNDKESDTPTQKGWNRGKAYLWRETGTTIRKATSRREKGRGDQRKMDGGEEAHIGSLPKQPSVM